MGGVFYSRSDPSGLNDEGKKARDTSAWKGGGPRSQVGRLSAWFPWLPLRGFTLAPSHLWRTDRLLEAGILTANPSPIMLINSQVGSIELWVGVRHCSKCFT